MKKFIQFQPRNKLYFIPNILLIAFALFATAGCDTGRTLPQGYSPSLSPLILVAGDATLQIFDTETESWRDPVGLGLGANWISFYDPHEMVIVNSISHNLQQIVLNSGEFQQTASIDLGLERNTSPYAVAGWGDRIAVTNLLTNSVSIVHLDSAKIVEEFPVGRAPEGILADHDTLYVINTGYDFSDFSFHIGSVYKTLATTGEILDTLALGMNPQFGAITNEELHIVCTGNYSDINGEVWILDLTTLEPEEILGVGYSPGRINIGYDNNEITAWIAAGGWSNDGDSEGLILSYNVITREILEPLSASLGVVDVAWNDADHRLYAVCRDAMKLDVFEGRERVASHDLVDPPNALGILDW